MLPTDENISHVARARARAIATAGGDVEWVIEKAIYYAGRSHHAASTAQQAVSWAITDIPASDEEIH